MFKLDRDESALLVIDIQERLVQAMGRDVYENLVANTLRLIKTAKMFRMPILYTQQYTKGLGSTVSDIADHLDDEHVEKVTFSCCGEDSFTKAIEAYDVTTFVVAGMETHICVLQTVIDLLERDYNVHVAADAVMSRHKLNWKTGLRYMESAGAMITVTETVLFQLLGRAGTPEFKEVSKLVR